MAVDGDADADIVDAERRELFARYVMIVLVFVHVFFCFAACSKIAANGEKRAFLSRHDRNIGTAPADGRPSQRLVRILKLTVIFFSLCCL